MATSEAASNAGPACWDLLRPWWPAQAAWRWRRIETGASLFADLHTEEAQVVAKAMRKRQVEFATGRWCAHQAMRSLGLPAAAIPARTDRSPAWPAGVVGTISHDDTWCVACVAHRGSSAGLGIDIERVERCTPDLAPVICTPAERQWLQSETMRGRPHALAQVFSFKEAVFKALYPGFGQWIDFHDAEVFDLPATDAGLCRLRLLRPIGPLPPGHELTGAVSVAQGRVLALQTLAVTSN